MDEGNSATFGFAMGLLAWLFFGDLYPRIAASFESDKLTRQHYMLERFVADNPVGSDRDVWIIKNNAYGMSEKVGLIFGFMDDFQFCFEVAQLYMERYPRDSYECMMNFEQSP